MKESRSYLTSTHNDFSVVKTNVANELLLQLGIILFWALVLGAIFEWFGLPAVLGYTAAGYLLGPNGLNIVQSSEFIQLLADLGIILLLFYIGLEFNLKKLLESGTQALFLSPIKSGFGFLLGYLVAKLLGFNSLASMVVGATVAVSSTGIISNTILERKLQHTLEARVVMSMLILEDIFSVIFLAFLLSQGGGLPVSKILLHIILILILILTVGIYLSRWFFRLIRRFGHEDKVALYALGLLVIFSYGVSFFGISPTLGAFFAGVALSEVAAASRVERELEILKRFFVLIFFTSIGLFYVPQITTKAIILSILLFMVQVINLTIISIISPFVGLPLRSAARLLILDLPIGEFSLFFAATASMVGIEGAPEILGAVFLTVFYTVALSNKLFRMEERVMEFVRRRTPFKGKMAAFLNLLEKTKTAQVADSEYTSQVKRHLTKIAINFIALLSVAYFTGYALTETGAPSEVIILLSVVLGVYPVYSIVAELLKLFTYHMDKIMKILVPKMDYFERRVAARKASIMALGLLVYLTAIILNILAQISNVITLQMLAWGFFVLGVLSFIYGALNLISFFVLR